MRSILQSRIHMLSTHPFFASLLLGMEVVVTENVKTAGVDGVHLFINPTWWGTLNFKERQGLLGHEILHIALLHHTRRNGRDKEIWNQACDYAINPMLKKYGFQLPANGLLDSRYDGMNAEQIYSLIYEDKDEPPQGGGCGGNGGGGKGNEPWQPGDGFPGGIGDVMDYPANAEKSKSEHEIEITEQLIRANEGAKRQGKGVGGIDEWLKDLKDPHVYWGDVLHRLMSEKDRNDYTWEVPNRMFAHTPFILPTLESLKHHDLTVAVDTSCSLSQQELNEIATEVSDIQGQLKSRMTVIYCDTKVARVEEFEPGDDPKLHAKGRGGTDFRPPFEWVEENELIPRLFLYFTDGECDDFPAVPDYDVIWVITQSKQRIDFEPPFGETIYMKP